MRKGQSDSIGMKGVGSAAESTLRAVLCWHAQQVQRQGLSPGTSGNLSVRCGLDMLITPSGVPFERLAPADLVRVGMDGDHAHALQPSSEWGLHRDVYQARPEVTAIVHAHPPAATTLSITRRGIPPLHYMVVAAGGDDIRCAGYATFGTAALSEQVLQALNDRTACLMANHGMIALGADLPRALWLAGEVEVLAAQTLQVMQVGGGVLLTVEQLAQVREAFRDYGLRQPARPESPLFDAPADR